MNDYHEELVESDTQRKPGTTVRAFGVGLLLAAVFAGGMVTTRYMVNAESLPVQPETSMTVFWEAWYKVQDKFPFDDQEPKTKERIQGAISGMIESFGDPHTVYLPPEENKLFSQDVSGEFGGVGMEVGQENGFITVIAPLKRSPAYRAGIQTGDYIIEIDGQDVTGFTIDEAVGLIRGEVGEPVELTIVREGESEFLTITIVREIIEVPTIDARVEDGIAIISIYSFTDSVYEQFTDAVEELVLEEGGVEKMIVDLRSNPGGVLNDALDVTSAFLPIGEPILIERPSGKNDEYIYRSYGYNNVPESVAVVLLVDRGSASAAEIFAGALQEYGRAKVVGENTFGKGSVQELLELSDGSGLKVTISKWYTPNGVSIDDEGLTPDYIIPYAEFAPDGPDLHMQKAREILGSL